MWISMWWNHDWYECLVFGCFSMFFAIRHGLIHVLTVEISWRQISWPWRKRTLRSLSFLRASISFCCTSGFPDAWQTALQLLHLSHILLGSDSGQFSVWIIRWIVNRAWHVVPGVTIYFVNISKYVLLSSSITHQPETNQRILKEKHKTLTSWVSLYRCFYLSLGEPFSDLWAQPVPHPSAHGLLRVETWMQRNSSDSRRLSHTWMAAMTVLLCCESSPWMSTSTGIECHQHPQPRTLYIIELIKWFHGF